MHPLTRDGSGVKLVRVAAGRLLSAVISDTGSLYVWGTANVPAFGLSVHKCVAVTVTGCGITACSLTSTAPAPFQACPDTTATEESDRHPSAQRVCRRLQAGPRHRSVAGLTQ